MKDKYCLIHNNVYRSRSTFVEPKPGEMKSGVKTRGEKEGQAPTCYHFWWSGHTKQKDTRRKLKMKLYNQIYVYTNYDFFIVRITQSLKDLVAGSME